MAELLNPQEIFQTSFETKTKNRFIMYLDGIPAYTLLRCDRPKIQSEKKAIDYINQQRYYKGKTIWQEMTMELYDPVVPSAAQAVMEWIRLGHESVSGRDGYNDMYAKDVVINVLGPVGDKVEQWTLKGAFPISVDFGELNYQDTGDPVTITVVMSVNYCILEY
jgi:hypothetical protein